MKAVHLNGLNGIRAIAALIVVVSHVGQALASFGLPQKQGLDMAGYGVTIFFTLSGFLITYLLLLEKSKFGDVNIKSFYLRRVLRIWPLYYAYLVVSILIISFYNKEILDSNIYYFFFLMANVPYILDIRIAVIVHFWSLGVEEQFYLFWPWVAKKVNKLFSWLVVFVGVILLLKVAAWYYFLKSGNEIPLKAIHITRFHCMAIGACAAILYKNGNTTFLRVTTSIIAQILVILVFIICLINKFHVADLINDELIALATAALIMNAVNDSKAFKLLDFPVLKYLGKISFGIYVYHPLILYVFSKLFLDYLVQLDVYGQYIVIYTVTLIGTILIAAFSYRFFELPFLRLKDKFARIKSAG